eukprot:6202276-Pleurochrysis_carterae.AAC.2
MGLLILDASMPPGRHSSLTKSAGCTVRACSFSTLQSRYLMRTTYMPAPRTADALLRDLRGVRRGP